MPPPSSENDLKRLARRRLIGAVALTLLAVILLPLMLEDEPPPTSSLSVHMAAAPAPVPEQAAQPERTDGTDAAAAPTSPTIPEPPSAPPPEPAAKLAPALVHEAAKPSPADPVKPEPAKPAPKPAKPVATPVPQAKHEAVGETFVVQLAALSDGAKARELKARAALAGLPVYTDSVGNLTRVRVGPYATREAAVAAAVKLAENGMTGQVLGK
jgi:DedD protein